MFRLRRIDDDPVEAGIGGGQPIEILIVRAPRRLFHDGAQIPQFGQSLTPLNQVVFSVKFLGISLMFWYALILTFALWYLFEFTSAGRRLLFVGRGREVARLSGVNVERVRARSLIAAGFIAALGGVLYTGMRGSADPSSGLAFLLPAFAAAFLGSTAIYPGRFNPWGAVVAVFFLSTGILGLNFLRRRQLRPEPLLWWRPGDRGFDLATGPQAQGGGLTGRRTSQVFDAQYRHPTWRKPFKPGGAATCRLA